MKVKRSDLKPVPKGSRLHCYRCKINMTDTPATMCKEMQTPNGSKYLRGWCDLCLDLGESKWTSVAKEKPVNQFDRPFRPGDEVDVNFSGKVLHYVSKGTDNVVVLVGKQGYTVKIQWLTKAKRSETDA